MTTRCSPTRSPSTTWCSRSRSWASTAWPCWPTGSSSPSRASGSARSRPSSDPSGLHPPGLQPRPAALCPPDDQGVSLCPAGQEHLHVGQVALDRLDKLLEALGLSPLLVVHPALLFGGVLEEGVQALR